MGPYVKEFRIFPRKTMHVNIGEPVDLDDLRELPISSEVLTEATTRIIDDITALLAQLRGEAPPDQRIDFKTWKEANKQEDST